LWVRSQTWIPCAETIWTVAIWTVAIWTVDRSVLVGLVVAGWGSVASVATADDARLTLDQLWPGVPADTGLTLEQRITDKVSDAGNQLGAHLDEASRHHASLRIDGRARRAKLHLGYGNDHLTVNFDSKVLFQDGKAIVRAKLELALQGHHLELELPTIDVSRDSYRNAGMTEVNVSVLEHRF
jgi:hypothetical protein